MYSSSPEILKHYVPLNFSKIAIDLHPSVKKKFVTTENGNPFKNKKLQKLQSKPKDFVLIFKNKSNKLFSAQKKIKPMQIFKKMNLQNEKNFHIRKQICKMKQIFDKNETDFNKHQPKSLSRHRTPLCTSRISHLEFKNYEKGILTHRLKTNTANCRYRKEIDLTNWKVEQKQKFQQYASLRISGSKAPQSETIDHFKRHTSDSFVHLCHKLVKSQMSKN